LIAVNLSSDCDDKLKIYRDNFEKAYLEATQSFYRAKAPEYLAANGVQNYMRYADAKLKEEEQRALRYLETRRDSKSVEVVSGLQCMSELDTC
jgi:cullin 5